MAAPPRFKLKILCASGFFVFIGFSVLSANLSIAAFRAHHIENRVAHWGWVGYLQDDREWQALHDISTKSVKLFSADPRHVLIRTRLLEWRSYLQRLYPDYASKSALEALEGYRKLIDLAPSLGYAWASIAELRAGQDLFDEETISAFENSVMLHPVEDLTQRRIIRAGIHHWKEWPDHIKKLVNATIDSALQTDTTLQAYPISKFIYDTAIDSRWENELHLPKHNPYAR